MPVVHLNSYRLIRYAWQRIASNVQLEWLIFLEEITDHSKCNLHNYENITAELLPDNRSSIAAITLSCFWVWSYFALNLAICGPCGSSNILLSGHLPSPVFIHTLASVVTTRKWVELDDFGNCDDMRATSPFYRNSWVTFYGELLCINKIG